MILAPVAAIVVFLVIGELCLIVVESDDYGRKYTVSLTEFRAFDRALGTGMIDHPHLPFALESGTYQIAPDKKITINSLGYRGAEFERVKSEGVFRILVLGDSYIYGYGMDDTATVPSLLEKNLRKRFPGKRIEVINAGFHGYNPMQYELYLRKEGYALSPDLIVLPCLSDNDIHDQNLNFVEKTDVDGQPEIIRDGLVSFRGRRYAEEIPLWLLKPPVLENFMIWFKIMKGANRLLSRRQTKALSDQQSRAMFESSVQKILTDTKAKGIETAVWLLTGGYTLENGGANFPHYRMMKEFLDRRGVEYLDYGKVFFSRDRKDFILKFSNETGSYDDLHFNLAGNLLVAEKGAEDLARRIATRFK